MSVVAKLRINEIINRPSYGEDECNATLVMAPVFDDTEPGSENYRFTKATPSGRVELTVTNPAALEQFQPGDEFYATFEKV